MNKMMRFLIYFSFVVIGLSLIALFWKNNILLTSIFVAISILFAYFNKELIPYLLVAGIIGVLSEIAMVYFGVWSYANPTAFGVPLWLPFVWAFAFATIKLIIDEIRGSKHG